jgi:hypothetical protein
MARQRSAPGRDSTSSERIAGISFFLFVLMQVPAFLTETTATVERVVLLSPLQVSAAHMANNVPGAYPYCQVPGDGSGREGRGRPGGADRAPCAQQITACCRASDGAAPHQRCCPRGVLCCMA